MDLLSPLKLTNNSFELLSPLKINISNSTSFHPIHEINPITHFDFIPSQFVPVTTLSSIDFFSNINSIPHIHSTTDFNSRPHIHATTDINLETHNNAINNINSIPKLNLENTTVKSIEHQSMLNIPILPYLENVEPNNLYSNVDNNFGNHLYDQVQNQYLKTNDFVPPSDAFAQYDSISNNNSFPHNPIIPDQNSFKKTRQRKRKSQLTTAENGSDTKVLNFKPEKKLEKLIKPTLICLGCFKQWQRPNCARGHEKKCKNNVEIAANKNILNKFIYGIKGFTDINEQNKVVQEIKCLQDSKDYIKLREYLGKQTLYPFIE